MRIMITWSLHACNSYVFILGFLLHLWFLFHLWIVTCELIVPCLILHDWFMNQSFTYLISNSLTCKTETYKTCFIWLNGNLKILYLMLYALWMFWFKTFKPFAWFMFFIIKFDVLLIWIDILNTFGTGTV